MTDAPKKFQSLEDLRELLPESERNNNSPPSPKKSHDGRGRSVRVLLDTKGRKGKSVTIVRGLQHNPDTMEEIAKILKQHCGAGGTVKDGDIEIQGDQRTRVAEKMRALHYEVKG
ncbi:MAG: translation initiation factor [Ignavibacteriales bacterium]|nr:translation initiation factor [Ignavibacteriales bacterium]